MAAHEAELRLEVASRTDRGVHARANALTLSSPRTARPLLRSLNTLAPDIWFAAVAEVPEEFRVRRALSRSYRYYEPRTPGRVAAYRRAARWFSGEIDVRSFGREVPADRPVLRTLDRVDVRVQGRWIWVDLRARSFAYGMVRKIVGALRAYATGELSGPELRETIRGERRRTLPLAEADRLVLWEVDHGVAWTAHEPGPETRALARWIRIRTAAEARAEILGAIRPVPDPGGIPAVEKSRMGS